MKAPSSLTRSQYSLGVEPDGTGKKQDVTVSLLVTILIVVLIVVLIARLL